MERATLNSTAANYPSLQGLYAVPAGLLLLLSALAFLLQTPEPWIHGISGGGVLLCFVACVRIARYYSDNYGRVTPTTSRQVRSAVAGAICIVILVGANIQGGALRVLPWSPDQPVSVFAASCALSVLVFCAMTVGLRAHHVVIWGSLLAASLLPIWGGLGLEDRWGAVVTIPVGVATIASGLLDHRLLVRSFGSATSLRLENSNVGG